MKGGKLKYMVEAADKAKKVNVLDLSSDQDLTIGLMNLLYIEDYISNSDSDLLGMVSEIRQKLMDKIVKKSDKNREISEKLLLESMQLINAGNKASGAVAYQSYDNAYEKYSLFWGVNMGLINKKDIK
jgi:hypothetical protein